MKKELKELQEQVNRECFIAFENFTNEYYKESPKPYIRETKFRKCSACIGETSNYIYLRSYNTIVAIIDKNELIFYDVLRMVYGYTATSCQHITKFKRDYKDSYIESYAYRDI